MARRIVLGERADGEYGLFVSAAGEDANSTNDLSFDSNNLLETLKESSVPVCDNASLRIFGISLAGYNFIVSLFTKYPLKLIFYPIIFGFSYHMLNGFRHILWDFGYLISNKTD